MNYQDYGNWRARELNLQKPNRVNLTDRDKRILRVGLEARTQVRRKKADERREEFMR